MGAYGVGCGAVSIEALGWGEIKARNSTIPTGAKQTFTTYADKQTGFDLHVVQGERETADLCRSLARFKLGGIPPMGAGMARLEVTFLVDADGILRVMARELTTGHEASIDVKPSYGLSEEQIEQMLLDSYDYAEEDLKRRLLTEAGIRSTSTLSGDGRHRVLVFGHELMRARRVAGRAQGGTSGAQGAGNS